MESMTTGPRINLLKKLCQENPDDSKRAIKKLCDEQGGLIEDRNHVIHGLWGIHWDHATGSTMPSCHYPKNRRDHISVEKLAVLSNRAAKFSNSLGLLSEKINPVFAGPRPRPVFFGKGDPQGKAPPPWPPEQHG